MNKIQNILVPIDLSPNAGKIAPYARMLAEKLQANVHLLFVARMLDHFNEMYVSDQLITSFQKAVAEGAERRLYGFRDTYFKGWSRVETKIVIGDIAEEILTCAQRKKMDLILMGTHGRKGLEKIFFGSVAEQVLKRSPVPVFLVNPFKVGGSELDKPPRLEQILFPVDLSEISPQLVPHVERMCRHFDAKLHLVSVVRPFGYFTAVYVADHAVQSFETEVLEETRQRLEDFKKTYFGAHDSIKASVVYGDISQEILTYGDRPEIDLIMMGTHGRKGLDKVFFGSVAERVAKSSPVPVYLINPYRKIDA